MTGRVDLRDNLFACSFLWVTIRRDGYIVMYRHMNLSHHPTEVGALLYKVELWLCITGYDLVQLSTTKHSQYISPVS
jgi:hypothetical protein